LLVARRSRTFRSSSFCLPSRRAAIRAPGSQMSTTSSRFRPTLVRVMAVQVVTLALLWLLQSRYAN
jgi:hypothetical protein